ncbi:MAG: hypothetical protein KF817_04485 [Phycisphaeraceae bacterium]|nr:hypothetical protein [Phycisphaeraceae bacterium]
MQYYTLKSILASRKAPTPLQAGSSSFFVQSTRPSPYIEPAFSKIEFPSEKPPIIVVSAVGAAGKTTTARALSFDTQLPILDLAKHKPVGDNTLTGILTTAYPIDRVGPVLEGLRTGTHGIIVDGIDEGRSKTTEEGFEAFLDDLIERSKGSPSTVILVFGRSQVLLGTWCYLADKGIDVGMVQIDPFDLPQAKTYIDALVSTGGHSQRQSYECARDSVLDRLSAAFSATPSKPEDAFLSFVGYPPVLDAISTLLREERNYHRVQQALGEQTGGQVEIDLLIRISDYLLNREHDEKALPNFIESIATEVGGSLAQSLRRSLYDREEQCARLLSRALAKPFPVQLVADSALNERYEAAVASWCPEHPFLDETRLRNAVFGAVAVARCALSSRQEYRALAVEYANANRPTYHLLYVMAALSSQRSISVQCLNMLMQSSSEFLGIEAAIAIDISGDSWEDPGEVGPSTAELNIQIEFPDKNQERTFTFTGILDSEAIPLGPYLVNAHATLPCRVELGGASALVVIGDCSISAKGVRIDTPDVIVRSIPRRGDDDPDQDAGLLISTQKAEGHANAVSVCAGRMEIRCLEHTLDYPLAKYVDKLTVAPVDPALKEKYRRLRRILSEFRSHKKGGLAKYRAKIEHERVLRGDLGRRILAALLRDGILRSDPKFYYVDSARCDAKLGISWQQLRQYKSSKELEAFLQGVP